MERTEGGIVDMKSICIVLCMLQGFSEDEVDIEDLGRT